MTNRRPRTDKRADGLTRIGICGKRFFDMQHSRQRFGLMFALVALLLTLAGCGGSPIVGKWQGNIQGMNITQEYKTDKTYTAAVQTPMGSISLNGTYTLEGEKLTETVSTVSAPGLPPQVPQAIKEAVQKNPSATVKFTDNDTMVMTPLTGGSVSITRTRIKDAK